VRSTCPQLSKWCYKNILHKHSGNFYNAEKHYITFLSEGGITCKPGGHPEKNPEFLEKVEKTLEGCITIVMTVQTTHEFHHPSPLKKMLSFAFFSICYTQKFINATKWKFMAGHDVDRPLTSNMLQDLSCHLL